MDKEKFHISRQQLLPPVLSGSALKLIAIITMFIDHIGAVLLESGAIRAYQQSLPTAYSYDTTILIYNVDLWIRRIGRVSFPIFCFLLVEGFIHTSNRKKYAMRLAIFALISEIPFDLCFERKVIGFEYQNVMFTLLIGLLTIWAMDELRKYTPALSLLGAGAGFAAAYAVHSDYDWKGILLIIILYIFRSYPLEKTIAGCLSLLWEAPACFAFIPLNMYNKKRGRNIKYIFYWFYPVHLLILFFIRYAIFRI